MLNVYFECKAILFLASAISISMRRSEVAVLSLAFLTAFTIHLLLFSFSTMIPLIIGEMGISYAEAGFIFSVCILAIILLRIPWGFFIDRIGFATAMKLAMVFVGVFSLLRGFSSDYFSLLASQLMLGVGLAALLPCLAKIVSVMFRDRAGFATGVYVLGFPVGEIVGLGLTSYLLLSWGGDWRAVFKIFGVWSIFLTVLWWLADRVLPVRQTQSEEVRTDNGLKDLIKIKQIWLLTGLCICSMGCYDTLLTWLPDLLGLRGMTSTEAVAVASMFPFGFLLSGATVGVLSDRLGSRKLFIWIFGLTGTLSIFLIVYSSQFVLWLAVLLAGFTLSGVMTLVLIISIEHPELSGATGGAVGLISSFGNAGSFLFPIIVGYLIDLTASPAPPLTVLAVIAGAILILNFAVRETGRAAR